MTTYRRYAVRRASSLFGSWAVIITEVQDGRLWSDVVDVFGTRDAARHFARSRNHHAAKAGLQ